MSFDWGAVASRIRGLIRLDKDSDLGAIAARLGVSEHSLKMSVDARAPLPTIDVIAALVRVYGLDPSWVLTGQYDHATHRVALESDTKEIAAEMRHLIDDVSRGIRPELRRRIP
ncbi:MAG: hypothetical protein WD825_08190 [Gemmatimonadaceae bacterium]